MSQKDYRSCHHGELRAESTGAEGIIEGYVTVWGVIDSYKSSFQRGAFTKTLQERGNRVKVLWNHEDEVIGKPIEIREDDKGLFARIQLVMGVPKAREVFELVKAGAIDTFSFGFRTVKDKWVDGVRVITEVMLMEVSPVIFEANDSAVITGVRNMKIEKRDQEYQATYAKYELGQRGSLIMNSLYRTLDDIWYSSLNSDEVRTKINDALTQFSGMYSSYTDEMLQMQQRDIRGTPVQMTLRKHLMDSASTPENFAANTSFTVEEVRSLLDGQTVEVDPAKLADLPEEVRKAIIADRASKIEVLCNELRRGQLDPAEVARIRGLLPQDEPEYSKIIQELNKFRASFT
jgi:HK97 family phage prohead protease